MNFQIYVDKVLSFAWLGILVAAIVISPQIVDLSPEALPKGWELPKVWFWQAISIILFLLLLLRMFWRAIYATSVSDWEGERVKFRIVFWVAAVIFFWFSFPVLQALLDRDAFPILLYGNPYRYQGFLTMLGVFAIGAGITIFIVRDKFTDFVLGALLASSVLQALVGLRQISQLSEDFPGQIFKYTDYIFGDFGQPNFFAGKLLLGVVVSVYFMMRLAKWRPISRKLKILQFSLFIPFIMLIAIFGYIIYFNRSDWGLITLAILVGTLIVHWGLKLAIFIYNLIRRRWYRKAPATGFLAQRTWAAGFVLTRIGLIMATFVIVALYVKYEFENYRAYIWARTLATLVPRNLEEVLNLLFGHGFDFLGNRFSRTYLVDGAFIDRAHHIFLDVMVNLGLVGFKIFFGAITWIYWFLLKRGGINFYLLLVLDVLLVRSLVHTNSIVNVMDLVVVFGVALGTLISPSATVQPSK